MAIGFREYQMKAASFAIYPATHKVLYPTLGLCGEAGEVAEKVKKQVRDGTFNRHEVAKELGVKIETKYKGQEIIDEQHTTNGLSILYT